MQCANAEPPNKRSVFERQAALALLNSDEFKELPTSQIVPRLADLGRYIASASTLYRRLRESGQIKHRRLERAAQKSARAQERSKPRALTAAQPEQIFYWDSTYLPTQVRGSYFYCSLYVDL